MELLTVEQEVERLLEKHEDCRSSDNVLFGRYMAQKGIPPINVVSFFFNYPKYQKEYGIPTLETIRRSRQKVQERRADLQASDEVKDARGEKQLEFWEYYK